MSKGRNLRGNVRVSPELNIFLHRGAYISTCPYCVSACSGILIVIEGGKTDPNIDVQTTTAVPRAILSCIMKRKLKLEPSIKYLGDLACKCGDTK